MKRTRDFYFLAQELFLLTLFIVSFSTFATSEESILAQDDSPIKYREEDFIQFISDKNLYWQLSGKDKPSKAILSDLFTYFEKYKNLNLNENSRFNDAFNKSRLVDHFASYLTFLKSESLINDDARMSESVSDVAKRVFPGASSLLFNMRKMDSTYVNLLDCKDKSSLICFADVLTGDFEKIPSKSIYASVLSSLKRETYENMSDGIIYTFSESLLSPNQKNGTEVKSCSLDLNSPGSSHLEEVALSLTDAEKIQKLIQLRPSCLQSILEYLYANIESAVDSGDLLRAGNGLLLVRYLESSDVRYGRAIDYLLKGSSSSLKPLIREYLTKESFSSLDKSEKLKIIFGGYLPTKFYVVFALLLIGGPLIFFLLYRSLDRLLHKKARQGPKVKKVKSKSGMAQVLSSQQPQDKMDEYTALLTIFGLTDEATDADIKKSYRDIIKRLHPDSGDFDKQRLEEIKKAHDRLIELRRGWFGLSR